jgi:hypothetical protein
MPNTPQTLSEISARHLDEMDRIRCATTHLGRVEERALLTVRRAVCALAARLLAIAYTLPSGASTDVAHNWLTSD